MIRKTQTFALSLIALSIVWFAAPTNAAAARPRSRAAKSARAKSRSSRSERASERVVSRRVVRHGRYEVVEEVVEVGGRSSARGGRMSRRERLAELRRQQEEARRREIARQQAIARERSFNQNLHDQAMQNIAHDETVGEDMEVRRVAVNALTASGRAGTVVVMNPKTGQIYTVVNQDWGVRKGYKPCSTIKLVTGLAGLGEHVISPVEAMNVSASGGYQMDLTDALAHSNNAYFQNVGGQVGFERIIRYARELGLGEKTGSNYPNEYAGALPTYKTGYAVNHMCSHGDDFEVTPLQLAALVSAIGNGGDLLVPHLPRTPQEAYDFKREVRRHLNIPQEYFKRMLPGMIGAVNYGTAKRAYDPAMTIAGKTGTCIGQGSWLGLFASYAPVSDPRLAVVVVTRGSHERSKFAAEIAGNIYRQLAPRFNNGKPIAAPNVPTEAIAAQPKAGDKKGAEAMTEDEERDEESGDAYVVSEAGNGKTDAKARPAENKAKPVTPTKQTETKKSSAPATNNSASPNASERKDAPLSGVSSANGGSDARPRRVAPR